MAKQVIYRRGTTAEHANFVGANGEVTVDTVKHVVVVHDGVTAGGFPVATASTVTASINTLTSNAAAQAGAITVLQANAAAQANAIVALQSNAAAQQTSINDFILASNATAIFANIAGVRANVEAANVQIGLLFGNATVQSEAIVLANANIIALQSGLTAANVEIANFVAGSGFADIDQLTANITAVNSAISTQGVTFATNVAVAALRANVTAANSAISSLQANIAAANVAINNIALSPALITAVADSVINSSIEDIADSLQFNNTFISSVRGLTGTHLLDYGNNNKYIDAYVNQVNLANTDYTTNWFRFQNYPGDRVGLIAYTYDLNIEAPNGDIKLVSQSNDWTFNSNGALTFPDNTVQASANIMLAAFTMANMQHWTSNVSTIGAALNQLAARLTAAGF